MATLSSRPPAPTAAPQPTQQDVLEAARPSINLLQWLTQRMHFADDDAATIAMATEVVEEALECMELFDYAVMPVMNLNRNVIAFDVAVKPLDVGAFAFFQVQFQVI